MDATFVQLAVILLVAVLVAAVMRILKQPLIIGYILTGIIAGPYFLDLLSESTTLGTFSHIGVALLLFTVGLHLNPKVIKEVGKISLITGVGQVIFTSVIGFLISIALGFSVIVSIYISIALTFSSTIIIMKLLSDKGDIESVYGKISIGFLIVQDLIAVFILMIISSSSAGGGVSTSVFETLLYGALSIIGLFIVSWKLLPLALKKIAKSQEFLLLFSIGWCIMIAGWFGYLNFSFEIGALLAGIALSSTPYSNEISSKMKPLRDFFIVVFFIVIGSQMVIGDIANNLLPIIIFSVFILIGNPFIVMILMGAMGYTKRTGFLAGLTVAQISEFSIILVSLGVSVGHLTSEVLSLVTVVGLITIAGSTYMITYSNWIYSKFSSYLGLFEKKKVKESGKKIKRDYDSILFGYNRIGFNILNSFKKMKSKYIVVDFNPDVITNLKKFGIPALYGDVYDRDFLDDLKLEEVKMIVSTIPEVETNELLIETVRSINKDAIIILRAHTIDDALKLYDAGANYVLTPHFLGGEFVARMIKNVKPDDEDFSVERKKHIKMLKEISSRGIEHPPVEKN
ncbi:MAG: cation:proton antiporter [archaeon]|nr:cation:proton antiporter [archaeon]